MELLRAQVDFCNRLYWVMSGETIDPPEPDMLFTPPEMVDDRSSRNTFNSQCNKLSQETA